MNILISGASFAGLSTAFWLRQLGHAVTIVEIAAGLRMGGTAVDIKDQTVDIARRMGILDQLKARCLHLERTEFLDRDGAVARAQIVRQPGEVRDDEFEIERSVLLAILHDAVRDEVELVFGDSIATLAETARGVDVTFRAGAPRTFDLVLGCDGMRSTVRALWFGDDAAYVHSLGMYFSVSIVDKTLIAPNTLQLYNVPGKAIMLNAYKDKTDIVFMFAPGGAIAYDHRDAAQQRKIIADSFAGVGWRAGELLTEIQGSTSFYFDHLCQVRMPAWSRGRVALVGDAGYCASPAAGMGGSLAIDGAAALGDAMRAHGDDYAAAFAAYDAGFRPFIDDIQAEAVRTGIEMLVPPTEEAIQLRNAAMPG